MVGDFGMGRAIVVVVINTLQFCPVFVASAILDWVICFSMLLLLIISVFRLL